MPVRVILRLRPKDERLPQDLFSNCLLQKQHSGAGLLISCGLHCAAAVALTVAGAWPHGLPEQWPPSGYEVHYLRVVVPRPLYFLPKGGKMASVKRSAGGQVSLGRAARPAPAPQPANVGVMRVPRVQAVARSQMVLIQPELRIEVPSNLKLPEVFAWSRHQAGGPAVPIVPGHSESGSGRPAVEPIVTVANSQERVGRVNVAPVPAPISAKLSISPQATTPLSFPSQAGAESERRISVDTLDADAVNLLASSPQHAKPGEVVRIPSGTAVPGANAAVGVASGAVSVTEPGTASAPGARVQGRAAVTEASGSRTTVHQEGTQAAGGGRARSGRTEEEPRVALAGANALATAATPGAQEPGDSKDALATAPVRKVHPKDGNFDVVVVQAARAGSARDDGVVLSGAQVYTVYVEVGTERPWVLQFCKPADVRSERIHGGVLQLSAAGSIEPPYPMVTVVPPPGSAFTASKLYVRGILNREGRFDRLSMVGETSAGGRQLLSLLEQWQFRPAMENGTAVGVEILLAIPGARN